MPSILGFSGWCMQPDLLRAVAPESELLDYMALPDRDAVMEACAGKQPDIVLGWSLGAALAVDLVQTGVLSPRLMVLIAPALKLVGQGVGMPSSEFEQFQVSAAANLEATLRAFVRRNMRADGAKAEDVLHVTPYARSWLEYLGAAAIHKEDVYAFGSCCVFMGEKDPLVTEKHKEWWMQQSGVMMHELAQTAHAPMLSQPDACQAILNNAWDECV